MLVHQDSMKEAIDARNLGKEEVARMSAELQQMREDRDMERAKVKTLTVEVERYKEWSGKSTAELEHLTTRANCLEVSLNLCFENVYMMVNSIISPHSVSAGVL